MRQHRPKLAKAFSRIASSLRLTDGIMRSPSIPSKVELSSKDCQNHCIQYGKTLVQVKFSPRRRALALQYRARDISYLSDQLPYVLQRSSRVVL